MGQLQFQFAVGTVVLNRHSISFKMVTPPMRLKITDVLPFFWRVFKYKFTEFFQLLFSEKVTIKTSAGRVIGYKLNTPFDYEYYNFIGIPYAQPPIGPLRFKVDLY